MANVAATIKQQLGGSRFEVMTGARNFGTTGNDLSFQIGRFSGLKIRYIKIQLEANDTYTLTFYDLKANVLKVREMVYANGLRTVIAIETRLELSL